jgi:hypothetical protein
MERLHTCTDASFYADLETAGELDKKAREQAAFCGMRIDGDRHLVCVQMSQAAKGFQSAIIYRNKYGFAVRDSDLNVGRISPNFDSEEKALDWARVWYLEAPHKREVFR